MSSSAAKPDPTQFTYFIAKLSTAIGKENLWLGLDGRLQAFQLPATVRCKMASFADQLVINTSQLNTLIYNTTALDQTPLVCDTRVSPNCTLQHAESVVNSINFYRNTNCSNPILPQKLIITFSSWMQTAEVIGGFWGRGGRVFSFSLWEPYNYILDPFFQTSQYSCANCPLTGASWCRAPIGSIYTYNNNCSVFTITNATFHMGIGGAMQMGGLSADLPLNHSGSQINALSYALSGQADCLAPAEIQTPVPAIFNGFLTGWLMGTSDAFVLSQLSRFSVTPLKINWVQKIAHFPQLFLLGLPCWPFFVLYSLQISGSILLQKGLEKAYQAQLIKTESKVKSIQKNIHYFSLLLFLGTSTILNMVSSKEDWPSWGSNFAVTIITAMMGQAFAKEGFAFFSHCRQSGFFSAYQKEKQKVYSVVNSALAMKQVITARVFGFA